MSRRNRRGGIVAIAGAAAACAACSLLVDTSGLTGGTADSGAFDAATSDVAMNPIDGMSSTDGATAIDAGSSEASAIDASLDSSSLVDVVSPPIDGTVAPGFGSPVVIASGQSSPTELAESAPSLYWINSGTGEIWTVYTDAGTAKRLVKPSAQPEYLQASGTSVYFTQRIQTGECSQKIRYLEEFSTAGAHIGEFTPDNCSSNMGALTINSGTIYGQNVDTFNGDSITSAIYQFSSANMAFTPVATLPAELGSSANFSPAIVILTGYAFWELGGTITRGEIGTMNTATFADGQIVQAMIGSGDAVYWINLQGDIDSLPPGSPGSAPTHLALDPGANNLAVGGGYVYWTNGSAGTIGRTTLPSGSSSFETIATNQSNPAAIAVDATNVYWTNTASGEVMRLALP